VGTAQLAAVASGTAAAVKASEACTVKVSPRKEMASQRRRTDVQSCVVVAVSVAR
jgi:hypothetical protein